MHFSKCLNRFRQYLSRCRQSQRTAMFPRQPGLEQLEDRLVPSTLFVDFFGKAHYIASQHVANNVTLSEKRVTIGHLSFLENILADTAEKITVTGPGANRWHGSGTNQVFTLLPIPSLLVDVQDFNDVVNVQAINYPARIRHLGLGRNTVNVGNAAHGVQDIRGPLTITAVFNNTT